VGKIGTMKSQNSRLLRLIALFKLVKALSLIALGVGALRLTHNPHASDSVAEWVARLGLNPDSRYLDRALGKIANLPPKDFRDLGIGSFVYAALFLVEGAGLWLQKRWGEWVTAIITGSLIPLEIFEICRRPTLIKGAVSLVNVAIVVYLVLRIRAGNTES
jgi:uncharacterized membrane protein (DUF2068 family)